MKLMQCTRRASRSFDSRWSVHHRISQNVAFRDTSFCFGTIALDTLFRDLTRRTLKIFDAFKFYSFFFFLINDFFQTNFLWSYMCGLVVVSDKLGHDKNNLAVKNKFKTIF